MGTIFNVLGDPLSSSLIQNLRSVLLEGPIDLVSTQAMLTQVGSLFSCLTQALPSENLNTVSALFETVRGDFNSGQYQAASDMYGVLVGALTGGSVQSVSAVVRTFGRQSIFSAYVQAVPAPSESIYTFLGVPYLFKLEVDVYQVGWAIADPHTLREARAS